MTVELGRPLPPATTLIASVKDEGRASLERARAALAPIVREQTPRDTGKLVRALEPRIIDTVEGAALVIGPRRGERHDAEASMAQVIHFLQGGTRLHKGPLNTPWGVRADVKGQKPDHFLDRIVMQGKPQVDRILLEGSVEAARKAESAARA